MSRSRRIILFDRSLPPEAVGADEEAVFICIDSFYHADLVASGKRDVKYILEYAKLKFSSYDTLFAHYKPRIDSDLRPQGQDAGLFEMFYCDISAVFTPLYFLEDLLIEIVRVESACSIEAHTISKHMKLLAESIKQ